MIGEIRKAITPYYNSITKKNSFKARPVLIIAKADNEDYVALPVSRVSKKENLDPVYDIEIDPIVYPLSNLNSVSYIRAHKQTIVHLSEVGGKIGDLKADYEELYIDVLAKREQFSANITEQAMSL